ncbi:hypothetical protein FOZ63_030876 [Perkinsus olseni]|uniref:RAP domain-containing protein n=1 Tax=Perkinsus olseni TaxID=32597 RepID=A0A7J6QND2_PEROL|nr:hypothetical protein FOZ63_030876 [Perkinsus olseni]
MRTASSLLKHRILEALGFTVIRVPYQEWSQCGTREKRLRYVGSFWKQLIDAKVVTEDTAKDVALGDVLEVAIADSQSVESAHDVIQRLARQLKENDARRPFAVEGLPSDATAFELGDSVSPVAEAVDDEPLFYKVSEDADLDERMRIRNEAERARLKIVKDFDDAEDFMETQRAKGIRGSREINYTAADVREDAQKELFDRQKRGSPRRQRDHEGFASPVDGEETDDDDDEPEAATAHVQLTAALLSVAPVYSRRSGGYQQFTQSKPMEVPTIWTYSATVEDEPEVDECVVYVQPEPWIFFVDYANDCLKTRRIMCNKHIFHYGVNEKGVAPLDSITAHPRFNPLYEQGRMKATTRALDPLPEMSQGATPPLGHFGAKMSCVTVLSHLRFHMKEKKRSREDLETSEGGFVLIPEGRYELAEMYEELCDTYEEKNAADVELFEKYNITASYHVPNATKKERYI